MPGSKRTDVPAGTARRCPRRRAVEVQRRVRLGEVVVRADLHGRSPVLRTVSASTGRPALIVIAPSPGIDLAPRDHEIGPCTVTSLVPSGKVASTCTSASISARPPDVVAGEHRRRRP
jgi:hypothetical protein